MSSKFVIFNADDFGYGTGINRGIVEAHRNGVVTSTSLMVNTPATAEAVRLARELPDLSLGLHVNFTNEAERLVDFYDPRVARDELRRQFDLFVSLVGRAPTHLDSHQHIHRVRECAPAFQALAAEHGLHLRDKPPVTYKGGFYGQWEYGVSDPTKVSVEALERILRNEISDGIFEMCVHPGYVDAEFVSVYLKDRERELATLTAPRLRAILEDEKIRLIGFRDLAGATRELARTGRANGSRTRVGPLEIETLPGTYAICRLPPQHPWPAAPVSDGIFSITRSSSELSIVCLETSAPRDARIEPGWRCLKVRGPLDLDLVGIMADLASVLAAAGVSLFAISTFETDAVLVRGRDLERALAALRSAGHSVPAAD
jgi:predicted glycoside hydrolase/deacetylase ChbG (UPF0249 family)